MDAATEKTDLSTVAGFNKARYIIGIIALFGASGGVIVGITRSSSYRVRMPFFGEGLIEIGIFGDVFIGAVTSIAAFYVIGSLLGLGDKEYETPAEWIKLISLSIIAGFAGLGLISNLSDQLVTKLTNVQSLVENVESGVVAFRQANEAATQVREGIEKMNKGNALRKSATDDEGLRNSEWSLRQALPRFSRALQVDPGNLKARVERAKVYSGLARTYTKMDAPNLVRPIEFFMKAIEVLDEVVEEDPRHARAYYNRACYRALLDDETAALAALEDLELAIEQDPIYLQLQGRDSDFDSLRNREDFKRLIERLEQELP